MNGGGLAVLIAMVVAAVKWGPSAVAAVRDSAGPPPPSVASWAPYVRTAADDAGIALAFVLRWFTVESGGNPFATGGSVANAQEAAQYGRAIGEARKLGPDGNPQEMSLSQLYNPDDLRALGVTGDQLRAGALRTTQKAARALTDAEKRFHADTAMRHIVRCRDRARAALNAAHVSWNDRDRYALCKLVHGLPSLVNTTLLVGTSSWSEFVARVQARGLNDRGALANAAKTAQVIP